MRFQHGLVHLQCLSNLAVPYAVGFVALFAMNHKLLTATVQTIYVHYIMSYVFWQGALKIGALAATWEHCNSPIGWAKMHITA